MARDGYTFVLDGANVDRLKSLADFETKEEPALAEDPGFATNADRIARRRAG